MSAAFGMNHYNTELLTPLMLYVYRFVNTGFSHYIVFRYTAVYDITRVIYGPEHVSQYRSRVSKIESKNESSEKIYLNCRLYQYLIITKFLSRCLT